MNDAAAAKAAEVTANGKPPWPAFQVERRSFAALRKDPRNARKHSAEQVRQIALAMREWGWTYPVLVDETDLIIAGHGRLEAAELNRRELPGDERWAAGAEAPVIVARGWTDAQKRAYAIADNQIALNAEWDKAALKLDLAELRGDLGFDLALIGFGEADLKKMLEGPKPPEEFGVVGEDLHTDYACPRCGYRWSGRADAGAERGGGDEPPAGQAQGPAGQPAWPLADSPSAGLPPAQGTPANSPPAQASAPEATAPA
jgi:hypothetical protein